MFREREAYREDGILHNWPLILLVQCWDAGKGENITYGALYSENVHLETISPDY